MALIDSEDPLLIAGCFHGGIAGYDCSSGTRLWHRKDIKKLQHLDPLAWGGPKLEIGAGLDTGSYRILEARSGTWLRRLIGVRRTWSNTSGQRVEEWGKSVVLASKEESHTLIKGSSGVLEAAFNASTVSISEVGGPISCFDFQGKPLWTWQDTDRHATQLCWAELLNVWLAVTWNLKTSGPLRISLLNPDGSKHRDIETNVGLGCIPICGGRAVVTSLWEVLSIPDLQLLWKLQMPEMPQSDP